MSEEQLAETEKTLRKIPARYLKAYELEAYEIDSPFYDLFMGYIKEYLKENIDNCTEIVDMDINITAEDTLSARISYKFDCEDFPYDQKDVDEFRHCHLEFEDDYEIEVILKDATLVDIVKTIEKHLRWHIEWEVEDEAYKRRNYNPNDEYVKPEERWPNDR